MKEQVKEWIVDKNLTTDSFDSIMIGVINNSGHNTLDDPDVRKWIETHPGEFRGMLPPNLSNDQQVVLEWWVKKLNDEGEDADPLGVICAMQSYGLRDEKIYDAAVNLTTAEQFQVLAAFAEWGMANA